MLRSISSSALVLGIALGVPSVARPAPVPLQIQSCTILQNHPIPHRPFWHPFGPYPYAASYTDGVEIRYVNRAAQTATRVAFVVNYRGDVERIIDAGTFSPGVTIDHTFGQFTGDVWLGAKPNVCRVAAVRYADGSVRR